MKNFIADVTLLQIDFIKQALFSRSNIGPKMIMLSAQN